MNGGMNDNMTTHVDKVKQGKEKGQGEGEENNN